MPMYEFRCEACGAVIEALRRMGQGPEGLACPDCGSTKLTQMLSSFAASSGSSDPSCSSSPSCSAGGGGGG